MGMIVGLCVKNDLARNVLPEVWIKRREGKKLFVEKVEEPFPPYFYVQESEEVPKEFLKYIYKIETGHVSYTGQKVKKLMFNSLSNQGFLAARDHFDRTYEDDVRYDIRYLIDKDVKYDTNQRVLYFDIETNLSTDSINTPKEIISICCWDNFLQRYVHFVWRSDLKEQIKKFKQRSIYLFDSEEQMLMKFIDYMNSTAPDCIVGWNSQMFDVPYVINRCKKLKLPYWNMSVFKKVSIWGDEKTNIQCDIAGCSSIDAMDIYKMVTYDDKPESYSLNFVSNHVLGETKLDLGNVQDMWKSNLQDLLKYNEKDVELVVKIDEKSKLLEYFFAVQQTVHCPLHFVFMNSKLIDMYLMREYHNSVVFPSKRKNDYVKFMAAFCGKLKLLTDKEFISEYKITGHPYLEDEDGLWAGVEPKAALRKNVIVGDFSALYTTIYISYNISPETVHLIKHCDKCIQIHDKWVCQAKQGFLPSVLEKLLIKRKEMEKERDKHEYGSKEWFGYQNKQGSFKAILNSFFGVMAFASFRLYNIDVPSLITYCGRVLLKEAYKFIENRYNAFYADTDSVFFEMPEEWSLDKTLVETDILIRDVNQHLSGLLKESGLKKCLINFDAEKVFTSLYIPDAKKQYCGLLSYMKGQKTERIFARGMALVRKDCPKPYKETLKETIMKLFRGEDLKEIKKYLVEKKAEIKTLDVSKIGIIKNISKDLSEYENNSQHIRAAKVSNEYLGTDFKKADTPRMLFIKQGFPERSDVIMIDEDTKLPSHITIDYKRMFAFLVEQKLKMFSAIPNIDILYSKDKKLTEFLEV